MQKDHKRRKNGQNWAKVTEVDHECTDQNRRVAEGAKMRRILQNPSFWDKPGKGELGEERRTAEWKRQTRKLRRNEEVKSEVGEPSSKRRVAESKGRPDPDRRSKQGTKQNGELKPNGELPNRFGELD